MRRFVFLAFAVSTATSGCRTTNPQSGLLASSGGSYTCEYKHSVARRQGAASGTVALGAQIPGFEHGETFVVNKQGDKFLIEANTTMDLKTQPYLKYAFACDKEHNCSGYLDKHGEGRQTKRTKMIITPGGVNVLAYVYKRPVFGFHNVEDGFEFWTFRTQKGNPLARGTTITCKR